MGWIAAATTLTGIWMVGNHWRFGFLMGMFSEILWLSYACHLGSWELGTMSAMFAVLYLINFFKWKVGSMTNIFDVEHFLSIFPQQKEIGLDVSRLKGSVKLSLNIPLKNDKDQDWATEAIDSLEVGK